MININFTKKNAKFFAKIILKNILLWKKYLEKNCKNQMIQKK